MQRLLDPSLPEQNSGYLFNECLKFAPNVIFCSYLFSAAPVLLSTNTDAFLHCYESVLLLNNIKQTASRSPTTAVIHLQTKTKSW